MGKEVEPLEPERHRCARVGGRNHTRDRGTTMNERYDVWTGFGKAGFSSALGGSR